MKFTIADGIALGVAGVSAIASIAATLHANNSRKKLRSVCEKLDKSLDDLEKSDVIEVDISEEVVNIAVRDKVDKTVKEMVPPVTKKAIDECAGIFREEVKKEINSQYSDIKGEVKDEVRKQIGNIDINDAKKEVIKEAKDAANKKFAAELDGVVDKFSTEFVNIQKIVNSINSKLN